MRSALVAQNARYPWWQFSLAILLGCLSLPVGEPAKADDASKTPTARKSNDTSKAAAEQVETRKPEFSASKEVRAILVPLFKSIANADVSRATVELSEETVINGAVAETSVSTYQIASRFPNLCTIYFKSKDDRQRLYSDGKQSVVAMAPDAYFKLDSVSNTQALATRTPISIGPYPEPVLALTLAGVDPAVTFLGGMKSVEIVQRTKFRGRTDSIHLRGEQNDGVRWNFWVSAGKAPQPLRLLVDLTPMLVATKQVRVPHGYEYSLRYDFKSWRVTGEVDDKLFQYDPPEDAVEYDSAEHYRQELAGEIGEHPLLGQQAPEFELTLVDGTKVSPKDLKDKIVVLDFWATWCGPCLKAMPTIIQAAADYEEKDVVFYAVNVGEATGHVKGYLSEQEWAINVAVDPEGTLAEEFSAKSIPLTLLISPKGIIEAAHVGFPGPELLASQFKDELDVLVQSGRIASSKPEPAEEKTKKAKP